MASGQEAPDASCPGPTTDVLTNSGNARYAQTFVVQNSGAISSAEITIDHNSAAGDYVVQLVTAPGGVPSDTSLASATIPDASVPPGSNVVLKANFTSPLPVAAGEQYALTITRPGATQMDIRDRTDNPCPGTLFESGDPGMAYSPVALGGSDMIFTIFVGPLPPDTAAPVAQITKGPRDKTKKRSATFEFTGTDARAIASFQCKLDSAAFIPCTSPYTVKVKTGKHTFQVQAIDQAGNVGAPATDTWKRKKRKR
jgi:hypothetical protein